MPTITRSVTADAPKSAVWKILDDFGNIQNYTSQVKTSENTSDNPTGVGAERFCELAPVGTTNEKILEYEPEDRMVIRLADVTGLPIKETITEFKLEALGENSTKITMTSNVTPKGGIMSGFIGGRLEKRLPKGLDDLLNDLAASAKTAA